MSKYLFLITFGFGGHFIWAQDRLEQLRQERQQLVFEWKTALERSSGLFGGRSKEDLEDTIAILEKIVRKDEQIVEELERVSERAKLSQTQHYNELLRQNNEQSLRIKEMEELLSRYKQWNKENHGSLERTEIMQQLFVILFAAAIAAALIFWAKYRKVKRNTTHKAI